MLSFFFFNDTATTEIYTLSLHDALPISHDDLGLELPAHRARAQGRAEDPTSALVREGQEGLNLPAQSAQQTRRLGRARHRRCVRKRRARSLGQPTEPLVSVEERPEAWTRLHLHAHRRVAPGRRDGGYDHNLPAQPRQAFRDARPAQTADRAVG